MDTLIFWERVRPLLWKMWVFPRTNLPHPRSLLFAQAAIERRISREFEDLMFHCLSDVWLDHPKTFVGLANIFERCMEAEAIPFVFVLCGNFTSRGIPQGNSREIQAYQGKSQPSS